MWLGGRERRGCGCLESRGEEAERGSEEDHCTGELSPSLPPSGSLPLTLPRARSIERLQWWPSNDRGTPCTLTSATSSQPALIPSQRHCLSSLSCEPPRPMRMETLYLSLFPELLPPSLTSSPPSSLIWPRPLYISTEPELWMLWTHPHVTNDL